MTKAMEAPSPQKVRRRSAGGKPAAGWQWQQRGRRVRRPDVGRLRMGARDAHLSSVGGLVSFNAFTREHGLHRELRRHFGRLKTGRGVVYPMAAQMQLLLDAWVAGAQRVLDVEMLAADPLFVHLAGGTVPSIDVLYDDLRRFDPQALEDLEELMSQHGTGLLKGRRHDEIFIDIDTTVMPLFGEQEGARPGPNPRYHGRPSYHPILAHIAQTGTVLGARLRPGDTSLGERDVEDVEQWLDRARAAVGPRTLVTVRIDSGGDCASLLHAIDRKGAWFLVKLKWTPNLVGAVWATEHWTTVDRDALGQPVCQVAEVDFLREDWAPDWRVFAVRSRERRSGHQTGLWEDMDYSTHFYVTNDHAHDADDLARRYDGRAGIEPIIAELKGGLAIGKVSTEAFDANEAAFLLKLLAFNLLRRWVQQQPPAIRHWRVSWIRRVCVQVPARLLRAGGRWQLRLAPRPMLT
jgi:hypothetical protein